MMTLPRFVLFLGLLLFPCLVSSIEYVHGKAETLQATHLRGAQHETQHHIQHAAHHTVQPITHHTTEVFAEVGAIVARKVETRRDTILPRNLPDADVGDARDTLRGDDQFIPSVLQTVNAVAGIDDLDDAAVNKLVDRAIYAYLKESQNDLFEQMRTFRMTWEPALDIDSAHATYRTFIRLVSPSIYLHVTHGDNVASILENGLKPNNGGQQNGISQGSVAAVRDLNVDEARGKSYVTRSDAEVGQYYGAGKQVLMIWICNVCGDDAHLHLDPDSQHGLFYTKTSLGKGVSSKTEANAEFLRAVRGVIREEAGLLDAFNADVANYLDALHKLVAKNRR
jgi:hypothetical protein